MASSTYIDLAPFQIENFIDRLTPVEGQKKRWYCPHCNNKNFTFKTDKGFSCWNGCTSAEVKEAIRPLKDALAEARQRQSASLVDRFPRKNSRTVQTQPSQPAPLTAAVILAKLPEPATDSPQPRHRISRQHEEEQVWRFDYSPTQWVERIQWAEEAKPKGYNKTYRQWHLAVAGEPLPLWENGKKAGTRAAETGEAVCSKGLSAWSPYRFDEAVQAAQVSGANFIMGGEGEPAVEQYRQLGIACITLQGSDWSEDTANDMAVSLRDKGLGLVYHPDHDKTGYKKARTLKEAFARAGVPFVALEPINIYPDVPSKGDAVDMVMAMGGEEYIKRLEAEIHAASINHREDVEEESQQQTQNNTLKASGMAAELSESYRSHLAWNDEGQSWYRYEADAPGVWAAESEISVGAIILAEIEARIGLNYTANYLSEVIKLLKHKLLVRKWEEPKRMLPFANGVLKLDTGEFVAHSPGYRFTYALPRDHDPLASDWSKINQWMDEATGGSLHLKNILLCWLNASLKGRSDLQRFLHIVGAGGTGKGTFVRLAIDLIGKRNHYSSSLQDWCGNRFESANAYKKRLLVFADEDKYGGGLGNFKKLTGGDALRAEVKNKTAFQYTYEGMVMVASNYPIFAGDSSSGMARRVLMIPFVNVVSPGQRRNMETEFASELAALTNHVLAISDEFVTQTLRQSADQSAEVIETTWEYRMRMDSVTAWLNECILPDSHGSERIGMDKTDATTLYGSYFQYCDRTGSRAKGSREFSPALLDLINNILHWDVGKKRLTSGFILEGLRLRAAADLSKPHCIEALSTDVKSTPTVWSNVQCHVETKLSRAKDYVGYVGSSNSFENNENSACSLQNSASLSDDSQEEGLPAYTLYTSQSEQGMEPCTTTLQMQGEDPTLMATCSLRLILEAMTGIDSIVAFEDFKIRYDQLPDAQQCQIWGAASPEARQTYQHWQEAFLAVPRLVWEVRKALLGVVTVAEMNEIRRQFDRDVLSLAFKLIHPSSQKSLKRLLKLSKQEQP